MILRPLDRMVGDKRTSSKRKCRVRAAFYARTITPTGLGKQRNMGCIFGERTTWMNPRGGAWLYSVLLRIKPAGSTSTSLTPGRTPRLPTG